MGQRMNRAVAVSAALVLAIALAAWPVFRVRTERLAAVRRDGSGGRSSSVP